MNTQTIYYSSAACGAGKTRWAVERIGRTPGRYIYAVDRTEEFAVRQSLIINNAIQSGASVILADLTSDPNRIMFDHTTTPGETRKWRWVAFQTAPNAQGQGRFPWERLNA